MSVETVRIELPIETVDNTEPGLSNIVKGLENIEKKAQDVQKGVSNAEETVTKFDRTAEKTQKSLSSWVKEKYEVLLEAKDKISPILSTVGTGLKNIGGKAWNVTMKAVDLVTSPVKGIINLLKNPLFQAGAILGVSISLKDTVETYANFEETMSRVKALSGANAEEMEKLTATAKEMGAKTKFSGTESAEAFTYMAQAGWGVNDMISGIGGIMSLAAADGLDLATTTDIVSNALTAFGLTAKDSAEFADVMAVASSATNTDVAGLGEAFKYIAPVAGAMGYSIQDASVALGLMSNNAVKGSMAGTSLKTALANMAAPTDKMATAMKKYGISLTDNEGNMKTLSEVMDNMRSSLGGLSEQEQTAAATTIFGKEAMAGMLSIINTSQEDYDSLTEAIKNSEGAADDMATTMQDNLAGALEQLGGAVETVQLSWGERLKPYILALAGLLEENMPAIEEFGLKVFDFIDKKIEELREKIAEFTSTDEWENADFFGKVKIAWDEIIANPFGEWWESTGKEAMANKAQSIGKGIGSAISTGLLALLGVDLGEAVEDGASVGASFARGLIDGFDTDALKDKIWGAIQGIFANAAKILPGGEEADLTSWISAAAIAKVGVPLLTAVGKGASLFGTTTVPTTGGGTTVIPAIGSRIIGSASAGTGLLGLGANTAINLGAGNLAGGASLSAGALSAVGLGSIAGGLAGGATLISGGMDIFNAFQSYKEGNVKQAEVEAQSGAYKTIGVAAGAATGAAIGSVVPVLGTAVGALVGAGVGGVAGWIQGDSVKKEYEESLKAAQEAAEALALAEAQAKYESQELKDALADASIGEQEFNQILQRVVAEGLKSHFGSIKLTADEIKSLASDIVLAGNAIELSKFEETVAAVDTSYSNLKSSVSNMEKLNWKLSLGFLDETDMETYKASMDAYVQSAKEYVESKHYEATAAINLVVKGDSANMTGSLNTMYTKLQDQLTELSSELESTFSIAMEDGVISIDEREELLSLQEQISSITQMLADAQTEAELEVIKIRYSGASLDPDTFQSLQSDLAEQVVSATQTYDDALAVFLTNLKLQLDTGGIDETEYKAQLTSFLEDYDASIEEMQLNVESIQFETIAEAYATELDGILPDIEGTTAEKLQTALHNAIANGVDVTTWDAETVEKWLGLEGLQEDIKGEIVPLLQAVGPTIPETLKESILAGFEHTSFGNMPTESLAGISVFITDGVFDQLEQTDWSPVSTAVGSGVSTAIENTDTTGINAAINTVRDSTGYAIDTAFSPGFETTTPVTITADYRLANPSATINFSGGGSGTATVNANIAKNAEGDIVTSPLISWIAEDGPEAIIPLGSKRRSRGLSLWERAGELLGVKKYASGGIVGANLSALEDTDINNIHEAISILPRGNHEFSEDSEPVPSDSTLSEDGSGTTEIKIEVNMSPTFDINGSDANEEKIAQTIKSHMLSMADELGGEIASRLKMVFSNRPLKGGT